MQDFMKLSVWNKAHSLTTAVYQATSTFPKDELYGLTSQIRRACVSIPANIAEGCGRRGKAEFSNFLNIAMGSANEVQYYLLLAKELQILRAKDCEDLLNQTIEVKRMLTALNKKITA